MSELAPIPGVVATSFRRIDKNTLIGIVDLEIPAWKLKFKGCFWHQKGSREWIAFPSREWLKDGERHFPDLIEFTDSTVRTRFQSATLAATRRLLDRGEAP